MDTSCEKLGLDFAGFWQTYRNCIRPDDVRDLTVKSFKIDSEFLMEFRVLKPFLTSDKEHWVDDILRHLMAVGGLGPEFGTSDQSEARRIYREHEHVFFRGRFRDEYLDSIEKVALFFIFHNVKSVFLVGAYRALNARLIATICQLAKKNRRARLDLVLKALSAATLIEVYQIQRTYMLYERHLSQKMVRELGERGMLNVDPDIAGTIPGLTAEDPLQQLKNRTLMPSLSKRAAGSTDEAM